MEIFDFITAFSVIYGKIQNTRQYEPKEPKKHNKRTFCRELFCQIVKDDNIVMYPEGNTKLDYRTLSAFESYYSKSNRKTFHSLAIDIINQLDEVRFIRFLVRNIRYSSKDILLNSFQQYLPSTTKRSLFCDITREWVRIITEEANRPDGRTGKQKVIHADDALINEISSSLKKLISIGRIIADSEYRNPLQSQTEQTHNFRLALQYEFQQLIMLVTSLSSSEAVKGIPNAEAILDTVSSLTPQQFILSESEYRIEWAKTETIHKLERLLLSILGNTDNNDAADVDGATNSDAK